MVEAHHVLTGEDERSNIKLSSIGIEMEIPQTEEQMYALEVLCDSDIRL